MNLSKKGRMICRILLGILIVLNMALIYGFSSEDGEKSTQSSGSVAQTVATIVVPDFEKKPEPEQKEIVNKLQFPIRKLAHMTEFGCLGTLVFLFLSTWEQTKLSIRFSAGVIFSFLYACLDEFHQGFTNGRSPQFSDALIDTFGAFLCCTLLLFLLIGLRKHKRKVDSK